MKTLTFFLLCVFSNGAFACTYNEQDQIKKLRQLSESVEGSVLNEATRELAWTGTDKKEYSVTYGGCDHLGHRIQVKTLAGQRPTERELFDTAIGLAAQYWWGGEGRLLKEALEHDRYVVERSESRIRYDLTGTDYAELYIESWQDGAATLISLGWVRDF